jgi:NAD(P)H-nitrite reductase large subunit
VEAVALDNGETLDCEMVIVGKGVRPNIELANGTGIEVGEGILVNEFLETNLRGIYAAGDVAQAKDRITGESRINALWPIAVEEGRVAGLNMAGDRVPYDGSMGMNSVEFFGLPLVTMGITRLKEGLAELVCEDKNRNLYKKVVLKGNTLVGMIFVNDIENAGVVGNLIRHKIDVSSVKDMLLDEHFDFAKVAQLIKEHKDAFGSEEFRDITLTY